MIVPCFNRHGISRYINNALWNNGYNPVEALDKKYSYQFTIKPTKKKVDVEEILSDVELEGIISQAITIYQLTNLQSQTLKERITSLLAIIESEIDKG